MQILLQNGVQPILIFLFFFFQVIEKFREQGANSLAELWAVSDGLRSSITELSFKEAVLRLTQRQYRRPFLTLNFLFVLTAFTGNFAITFYAVDIFQHSGNGAINSYLSAIIIGAIKFLGAILYIPAVKYISRYLLNINHMQFHLVLLPLIMGHP